VKKPRSIIAPRTYNPGKGRPKEHLAYLNYQEMLALKRLNGNNQERGPRGLPSFPPSDAAGSSSKASSSTSSGSTSSNSSGPSGGMMVAPVLVGLPARHHRLAQAQAANPPVAATRQAVG